MRELHKIEDAGVKSDKKIMFGLSTAGTVEHAACVQY